MWTDTKPPADKTGQATDVRANLTFATAQSKALNDYWFELAHKAKGVPARADFDPIAIPALLPNILLYEKIAEDQFRVRLQGTEFSNRGIPDATGNILAPFEAKPDKSPFFKIMARVLNTPCGLKILGVERNSEGRNVVIEAVGFPLNDANGKPTFLVAIVTALATESYVEGNLGAHSLVELRETSEITLHHLGD